MTLNISPINSDEGFEQIAPNFYVKQENLEDIMKDIKQKFDTYLRPMEDEVYKKNNPFFVFPEVFYRAKSMLDIYRDLGPSDKLITQASQVRNQIDTFLRP